MSNRPLVSVDWLHEHLHDNDVSIIEASWHMPASGRSALSEFAEQHIPGAVFFDIDAHSSPSALPHMMPSGEQFAQAVSDMGVSETQKIVVYDSLGLFSAARVWWMFRYFGAERVYVLDGGLPAWLKASYPTECGPATAEPSKFTVAESLFKIADAGDVLRGSNNGDKLILDARSYTRFTGEEKEVRAGLRSGHIPGSQSMPFTELLNEGRVKPNNELQTLLAQRGLTDGSSVITSCGSGVTAAVICLALECVGVSDVALYDGSWTEWGGLEQMPVATG